MTSIKIKGFPAVAVLLLSIAAVSCAPVQKPALKEGRITGVRLKGLTSADICFSVCVENPNRRAISAEDVSGSISKDGVELATFEIDGGALTAAPSCTSTLQACASIKITDPLALLAAGVNMKDPDVSTLTADADIKVKMGGISKKIKLRNYSLSKIARYLNE